jgi:hypothetical protein
MIESTALALSLWYLYFIQNYLSHDETVRTKGGGLLAAILTAGMVAAMTKVTTFSVYYLIGVLFMLISSGTTVSEKGLYSRLLGRLPLLAVSIILPLVAAFVWTRYSDHIKSFNPIGTKIMSKNLEHWNFGTWAQKLTMKTWRVILTRSITDLIGNVRLFFAVFLMLPFCRRRTVGVVLLVVLLYLLPVAIFTNLYYVHNYYSYANGILLLLAIALIIGDLSTRGLWGYLSSVTLLGAFMFFSAKHYVTTYLPVQGEQFRFEEMKEVVNRHTKPDDVLVIFGADWSSAMPYYLERRALMFPASLTTAENYGPAIEQLRPYRIGGVMFCSTVKDSVEVQQRALTDLQVRGGGDTVNNLQMIGRGKSNPESMCSAYFPPQKQ